MPAMQGPNQLTGTLPSSWSTLVNLRNVVFQINPFLSATLPSAWSTFTALSDIFLSGMSQLAGSIHQSWARAAGSIQLHNMG